MLALIMILYSGVCSLGLAKAVCCCASRCLGPDTLALVLLTGIVGLGLPSHSAGPEGWHTGEVLSQQNGLPRTQDVPLKGDHFTDGVAGRTSAPGCERVMARGAPVIPDEAQT